MKTVLVIFGGRSPEHDVSVISAVSSVVKPLELTGDYKVEAIYIDKQGAWHWGDEFKDIALYRTGKVDEYIKKSNQPQILLDSGLTLVKQAGLGRTLKQKIDVVFPVMHGSYGEDGALMGLLEMAGIPYVGCDVPSAALAMDKVLAKQIAQANEIKTTSWVSFSSSEFVNNPSSIYALVQHLTYPLFVKPAHAGSSIGITKVDSKDELTNAVEVAAHYDSKILIEEAVTNLIEVTLPIIGNDELTFALLERPITHDADSFFDFEAKYMHGAKGKKGGKSAKGAHGYSELPAMLSDEIYKKAEAVGASVYKALGCKGTARVDMLIDSKTSEVYFNEVNPMPGSLYAHNWRQAGLSGTELVKRLVQLAEELHTQKQLVQTSFSTSYLKQF